MTVDDKIRGENSTTRYKQKDIKNVGEFILTGGEILPSDSSRVMEQTKFTYSPLGEAIEKQIKTVENHGEKQIKAINDNK